ncbi:DUF4124 domain-containing protein [Microbulbifer sp. OS29]|uniref:DUF4124 domain-containing protein n=1 Tax=Microbulbifer okhotskensis TaxID=2926617 RepID=A0A9X2J5Y2_9GAMM|nr:DUF4124 domain-containing protein [Microbulbifer okhotskensis]MCO1334065.1 DUF4124 domain-containing protein [Microbulbifer okhotskensis]
MSIVRSNGQNKKLMQKIKLILLTLIATLSSPASSQIYKYKNKDGNWIFSDKRPNQNTVTQEIKEKHITKKAVKPKVFTSKRRGSFSIVANNPYSAPIQVKVKLSESNTVLYGIIPPKSKADIFETNTPNLKARLPT